MMSGSTCVCEQNPQQAKPHLAAGALAAFTASLFGYQVEPVYSGVGMLSQYVIE